MNRLTEVTTYRSIGDRLVASAKPQEERPSGKQNSAERIMVLHKCPTKRLGRKKESKTEGNE